MTFMIMYMFIEEEKYYACYVTPNQYKNINKLSIIRYCEIIKRNQLNYEDYHKEMQKALDQGIQGDTRYIRKLSISVPGIPSLFEQNPPEISS